MQIDDCKRQRRPAAFDLHKLIELKSDAAWRVTSFLDKKAFFRLRAASAHIRKDVFCSEPFYRWLVHEETRFTLVQPSTQKEFVATMHEPMFSHLSVAHMCKLLRAKLARRKQDIEPGELR